MQYWTKEMLVGGHPLLDFLNTVGDQDKSRIRNHLNSWNSFLEWAKLSDLYSKSERSKLRSITSEKKQSVILTELVEVREIIFEALQPFATNQPIADKNLKALETLMKDSVVRASFVSSPRGYRWNSNVDNTEWVIDVVLLSLEDLLRNVDPKKIRECGRCSWLFVNQGRGVGRKWCNMKTCGNRAKAEVFRSG